MHRRLLHRETEGRCGGGWWWPRRPAAPVFPEGDAVAELTPAGPGRVVAVSMEGRCAVLGGNCTVERWVLEDPHLVQVRSAYYNRLDGALILLKLRFNDGFTTLRCELGTRVLFGTEDLRHPGFVEFQMDDNLAVTLSAEARFVLWDLRTYEPVIRFSADTCDLRPSKGLLTQLQRRGEDVVVRVWSASDPLATSCLREVALPSAPTIEFIETLSQDVIFVKRVDCDCDIFDRGRISASVPGTSDCRPGSFLFDFDKKQFLHFEPDGGVSMRCGRDAEFITRIDGIALKDPSIDCVATDGVDTLVAINADERTLSVHSLSTGKLMTLWSTPNNSPITCLSVNRTTSEIFVGTEDGRVVVAGVRSP